MIAAILLLQLIPAPQAPAKKPALTCPKYEHVQHWAGSCGPTLPQCDSQGGTTFVCPAIAVCTPVPSDVCVDDMHEVTEKEWRSILKRLRDLEFKTSGQPIATGEK